MPCRRRTHLARLIAGVRWRPCHLSEQNEKCTSLTFSDAGVRSVLTCLSVNNLNIILDPTLIYTQVAAFLFGVALNLLLNFNLD